MGTILRRYVYNKHIKDKGDVLMKKCIALLPVVYFMVTENE